MTLDAEGEQWILELPQKSAQYSIVFVQLGHAASTLRESVVGLPGVHLEALKFCTSDFDEDSEIGTPTFLHNLESLRDLRSQPFGILRERIMRRASQGQSFVLVSRVPKTAYPDGPGSDVIADAKQIFAPLGPTAAPADLSGEQDPFEFHVQCIRELGDRTIIALSEALWELHLSPLDALAVLTRPDMEGLRGAGLIAIDGERVTWNVGASFKHLRLALALVSSEGIVARQWVPDTYAELWMLERTIRNVIRAALMSKCGEGWRDACLSPALKAEVVERAQKDSQPRAEKISDLRDPLEWLTTSELLDLRESRELGSLGMEPFLWGKLRNEIVPIRNKVAHMRMVSEQDAQRATMWRHLISRRLK